MIFDLKFVLPVTPGPRDVSPQNLKLLGFTHFVKIEGTARTDGRGATFNASS